jgi:hypothetical protein
MYALSVTLTHSLRGKTMRWHVGSADMVDFIRTERHVLFRSFPFDVGRLVENLSNKG